VRFCISSHGGPGKVWVKPQVWVGVFAVIGENGHTPR
jgi:hypothetical protein